MGQGLALPWFGTTIHFKCVAQVWGHYWQGSRPIQSKISYVTCAPVVAAALAAPMDLLLLLHNEAQLNLERMLQLEVLGLLLLIVVQDLGGNLR